MVGLTDLDLPPPLSGPFHRDSPYRRFEVIRANRPHVMKIGFFFLRVDSRESPRPGHWSEPGEYNILFPGSILVISCQDSSALGYR